MSDFNVKEISKRAISPELILARAWAHRENCRDIVIVTIDKSGVCELDTNNIAKIPQIAELLTKAGMRHLMGED